MYINKRGDMNACAIIIYSVIIRADVYSQIQHAKNLLNHYQR